MVLECVFSPHYFLSLQKTQFIFIIYISKNIIYYWTFFLFPLIYMNVCAIISLFFKNVTALSYYRISPPSPKYCPWFSKWHFTFLPVSSSICIIILLKSIKSTKIPVFIYNYAKCINLKEKFNIFMAFIHLELYCLHIYSSLFL